MNTVKAFDAEAWAGSQAILHEMYDPEDIARAYREINRYRILKKQPTFDILIPPPKSEQEEPPGIKLVAKGILERKESQYGGDCCTNCGSTRLQRSGTCHVCLDCSESQGCS